MPELHDSVAHEWLRDRPPGAARLVDGSSLNRTEVGGDLITQLLFDSDAEQVRRVSRVRPVGVTSTHPGRARRLRVAHRAAVGQSAPDAGGGIEVADPIADAGALALRSCPFPLEELATPLDRPKRIAVDDEDRGI